MKPNFALNLTFDGIGLLHRVPSGWHLVGEVSLESPDLGGALSVLRQTALALDPAGLRCKLVIPTEQIRFMALEVDPHAGEAEVRAALDGATPYAVDDLAYDWTFEGSTLFIAAVAKETLAEAEAFATAHAMNPVSFVATPDQGVFPGEPFFGLTAAAPGLVGAGVSVGRDLQPIRVIGHARLPSPDPVPEHVPAPVPDLVPEAVPDETMAASTHTPAAAVTDPAPAPDHGPVPEMLASADTVPATAMGLDGADATPVDTPVAPPHAAASANDLPAAPRAVQKLRRAPASGEMPSRSPDEDIIDPPAKAPFVSIRAVNATAPAKPLPPAVQQRQPDTAPRIAADSLRPRSPAPLPAPSAAKRPDRPDLAPPAPPVPLAPATRTPVPGPAAKPAPAAKRASNSLLTGVFASIGRAFRRAPRNPGAKPILPAPRVTPADQAQMTVFGARKPVAAQMGGADAMARGKPRYLALGLTLALLVFLAGVAAWASIFGETTLGWLRGGGDPVLAESADGPAIDASLITPEDLADVEPEMADPAAPPGELVASIAFDTPSDAGIAASPGLSEPNLSELATPPTAEETAARYAATGIWQIAPDAPSAPGQIDLDQLYIASIDPAIVPDDVVALPGANSLRPDGVPGALSSPAAAGTRFTLDPRGFVAATPEGALTPDGVRVIAGRPPLIPPAAALTRAAPAVAEPAPADARLAAFRPRLRPDNLTDGAERAELGGLTRNELAGFRPRPRPATIIARAEAAAKASEATAAATATNAAAAASTAAVVQPPVASPPGLAAVKPKVRPDDLRVPVIKTPAQPAAKSPEQKPAADEDDIGVAARAPTAGGISREEAEDDEGEVQVASARGKTVTPKVPSQANVAKAATEKNVLNLREVNLIGVYGSQQSRRALVRLSNGRYQKVKVGDRVDGGRVVAISDGELRYTKGGRNVTLKMPRS